jgi:hypothetical protein
MMIISNHFSAATVKRCDILALNFFSLFVIFCGLGKVCFIFGNYGPNSKAVKGILEYRRRAVLASGICRESPFAADARQDQGAADAGSGGWPLAGCGAEPSGFKVFGFNAYCI